MSADRLTSRMSDGGGEVQTPQGVRRNSGGESLHLPASPQRVSRGRLEEIRERLTPTDVEILTTLGVVRVATSRQLQQLHVTEGSGLANARRARRRLERLAEARVIYRLPRRVGGLDGGSAQAVYALDVVGQRLLSPARSGARKPWVPFASHLRHTLAVTETFTALVLAEREGVLRLDDWSTEPLAWRETTGAWGSLVVKPDAFVRLTIDGEDLAAFLEVDYATESLPVILKKAEIYWRYYRTGVEQSALGYFPEVLWLVPDQHRLDRLTAALAKLPPEQWMLHRVAVHDDLARTLLTIPP